MAESAARTGAVIGTVAATARGSRAGAGTGAVVATAMGGGLWILGTLQFGLAQLVAAAAWNPPYSWRDNYISDLGNTACGQFALPRGAPSYVCSPLHAVMNAAFILAGGLTIAGALLLWRAWPPRRLSAVAMGLLLVAGLGKLLVGAYPENTDLNLHLLGALNIPIESIAIMLVSLSMLQRQRAVSRTGPSTFQSQRAVGLASLSRLQQQRAVGLIGLSMLQRQRAVGLIGLGLGVVGLAGTVLEAAVEITGPAEYRWLGVGGVERVADYPGSLWMLVIGCLAVISVAGRFGRASTGTVSE